MHPGTENNNFLHVFECRRIYFLGLKQSISPGQGPGCRQRTFYNLTPALKKRFAISNRNYLQLGAGAFTNLMMEIMYIHPGPIFFIHPTNQSGKIPIFGIQQKSDEHE
jgi:hypothetical protein